jgi:hypothetical protein
MPLIQSRKTMWEGLNGTHHLLVYVYDTIKKNTESLSDDSKEVGLEVNTECRAKS